MKAQCKHSLVKIEHWDHVWSAAVGSPDEASLQVSVYISQCCHSCALLRCTQYCSYYCNEAVWAKEERSRIESIFPAVSAGWGIFSAFNNEQQRTCNLVSPQRKMKVWLMLLPIPEYMHNICITSKVCSIAFSPLYITNI